MLECSLIVSLHFLVFWTIFLKLDQRKNGRWTDRQVYVGNIWKYRITDTQQNNLISPLLFSMYYGYRMFIQCIINSTENQVGIFSWPQDNFFNIAGVHKKLIS